LLRSFKVRKFSRRNLICKHLFVGAVNPRFNAYGNLLVNASVDPNNPQFFLYLSPNATMTHPKRTTKPTEKVRQAQLDFATPENHPTKRARVAAPTIPAHQTLPALSMPALTRLSSPRALLAASQQGSQPLSKNDAFELELRELQLEGDIVAPTATLHAPIVASADNNSTVGQLLAAGFNTRFADNFDDIIWLRLPGYRAPLALQKHKKSWIYAYGYCINSTVPQLSSKVYFVCKICHLRYHKACSGIYNTTTSPSTGACHLNTAHQIYNPDKPAARHVNNPFSQFATPGLN
jgi:hypothetical protein